MTTELIELEAPLKDRLEHVEKALRELAMGKYRCTKEYAVAKLLEDPESMKVQKDNLVRIATIVDFWLEEQASLKAEMTADQPEPELSVNGKG